MFESIIDTEAIQANAETAYNDTGVAPISLDIGTPSADLVALKQPLGYDCSALIMACNRHN